MDNVPNENHRSSLTLTLLNVLNVLNVLAVLYMPKDASLACWALLDVSSHLYMGARPSVATDGPSGFFFKAKKWTIFIMNN